MAALQQSVPRENPGQGSVDPYGNSGPSTPGAPGIGVPSGGTTGQVLAKTSNTDYATGWTTASGGLSPIGNNLLLGNISGSSAIPTGQTLSAILDAIVGNTQGQMLTRNGTVWTVLNPGAANTLLRSNGAGANLSYVTLSGLIDAAVSSARGSLLTRTAAGRVSLPPSTGGRLLSENGPTADLTWITPALAAYFGKLDPYTSGLWGAYGLNRLLTAYTGPLIRVRRSSDNAEINVGYLTSGRLDTPAMIAFAPSPVDAFVVTWYDQSGAGNHLTQSTLAAQPKVVTTPLNPYVEFDGSDDVLTTTASYPATSQISIFSKFYRRSFSANAFLFSNTRINNASYSGFEAFALNGLYELDIAITQNGLTDFYTSKLNDALITVPGVYGIVMDRTLTPASARTLTFKDGVLLGAAGATGGTGNPTGPFTSDTLSLGFAAGSGYGAVLIQSFMLYTTSQLPNYYEISYLLY